MNIGPTRARALFAAAMILALVESLAAARAYRSRIDEDDWRALAAAVEALPPDTELRLATPWLGPSARMHIAALAEPDAVAAPDLRGVPQFVTIGLDDGWSSELEADLEDLPHPHVVAEQQVGPFRLWTWAQPAPGRVLADALTLPLRVTADGRACPGRDPWRCAGGAVSRGFAEIEYRPRRCVRIEAAEGSAVRIEADHMPTGNVLRGHVGFPDFNRRLRSAAPVSVIVHVDAQEAARFVVTDDQGWWPFAVATSPGQHDIALEILAAARGTWWGNGYDAQAAHATCVEFRTLAEDAP